MWPIRFAGTAKQYSKKDIAHTQLFCPVVVLLKTLAEGAKIHKEDVALQPLAQVLFGHDRFLGVLSVDSSQGVEHILGAVLSTLILKRRLPKMPAA